MADRPSPVDLLSVCPTGALTVRLQRGMIESRPNFHKLCVRITLELGSTIDRSMVQRGAHRFSGHVTRDGLYTVVVELMMQPAPL